MVRIAPSQSVDVPRLNAIEIAADGLFPPGRLPADGGAVSEASFARAVAVGGLVEARTDDEIVGFAVSVPDGNDWHLLQMAVDLAYGGQGIGRRLLRASLTQAAQAKAKRLVLTTFADVPWNAPFYASEGFEHVEPSPASSLGKALAAEAQAGMTDRVAMARML